MKKILSILCVMALVILASCGGGETKKEPAQENKQVSENLYEGKYWSGEVPEGWIKDEEFSQEHEGSETTIFEDGSGNDIAKIEVSITEDPSSVRKLVLEEGYTLEDYRDKKIEKSREIGEHYGIQYQGTLQQEKTGFVFRNEGAKATANIVFNTADLEGDGGKLLDSFQLKAEDEGHKDPPYPSDGMAYEAAVGEGTIGTTKLKGEFLKLPEPFTTYEVFDIAGTKRNNYIYLLCKDKVRIYNEAEGMKFEKEIDLENRYEKIDSISDGRVVITNFASREGKILEGIEKTIDLQNTNMLELNEDGSWGLEYSSGIDTVNTAIMDENGVITRTPLALQSAAEKEAPEYINELFLLEDKFAAEVKMKDQNDRILVIYDKEGKEIQRLEGTEEDPIGAITGCVETDQAYIAADANLREFKGWSKEGTYIGKVDMEEIIGTDYPWIGSFYKAADGNCYLTATDTRSDQSSGEVLFFKINIE